MANSKVSALTGLTTPSSTDELYIVDVSDTTDGASGTSKKITHSNFYKVDTIAENTSAAGVTIDGVLLKDSIVKVTGTNGLVFDLANDITVTASNPSAARVATIPGLAANDTFVFLAETQTLTNKTVELTSNTITFPAVRVSNSANQSINDSSDTALSWNTEDFDTGMHAAGNPTRITITTAGIYMFVAQVTWPANATGTRQCYMKLNNTTNMANNNINAAASRGTDHQITEVRSFAANDYVEVIAYQTSGAPINVETDSFFAAYYLRGAV